MVSIISPVPYFQAEPKQTANQAQIDGFDDVNFLLYSIYLI